MGTDSPAPVAVDAKNAVRAVAQHHRAVVGFLLGFFLVLLLHTTLSSQFGSQTAIGVLQPSSAARTNEAASAAPSLPSSTPSNFAQGDYMEEEGGHKNDKPNEVEEHIQDDDAHRIGNNNQSEAKLDVKNGKNAEQADQPAASEASDRMEEELIRQEIDQGSNKKDTVIVPATGRRKPICDLSDPRYDICEISGDARTMGANRTVVYVPPVGELGADSQEWSIRDQSRKYLEYVNKVTVKSLNASQSQAAPECTSRHGVRALVFAMNGLTSNPWHDFSDVLIPLFITTRALEGEVQFLVSDLQPWFVDKYRLILKNLSRYDIVDFNQDGGVRCYPHVTVGLRGHRDLGIDPARAPRNYTMLDFRLYIREIYGLPSSGVSIPYKYKEAKYSNAKPRLMLINRGRTRKFVNFPEIVAAVQNAGFEVIPIEPRRDLSVEEFSRVVDSCDVLMGAHGAGLTNFFFLRTNAVMLQVVPWGHMEHPSVVFYGGPAKEMRLRDVEYNIADVESTLYDRYGRDNPVVRDPESIHKQGWQFGMRYYWIEQDIRLNVTRFAPTLHQVLQMLRE